MQSLGTESAHLRRRSCDARGFRIYACTCVCQTVHSDSFSNLYKNCFQNVSIEIIFAANFKRDLCLFQHEFFKSGPKCSSIDYYVFSSFADLAGDHFLNLIMITHNLPELHCVGKIPSFFRNLNFFRNPKQIWNTQNINIAQPTGHTW